MINSQILVRWQEGSLPAGVMLLFDQAKPVPTLLSIGNAGVFGAFTPTTHGCVKKTDSVGVVLR
jgi:hypothetical protein